MKTRQKLLPFLSSLSELAVSTQGEKDVYVQPALKRLGSVSIVLVREIVAPAVFRNQEAEITDLEIGGTRVVRAVPNKFKHKERARGLQLLRHFGAGGNFAQNKTVFPAGAMPSDVFDLNTLVFGDSAMQGNKMLPVKAGALYSDALSLADYEDCVSSTFHNRANEAGTLFDAEKGENSVHLFERHVVKPGTLMVQVVSTHGRSLPVEAFEHLLLSIGQAGAYGGQTSVTGVNVRTRIAAIVAGKVERANTVPGEIVKALRAAGAVPATADDAVAAIAAAVSDGHEIVVSADEATAWQEELATALAADAPELANSYAEAAKACGELFNAWFENVKDTKGKKGKAA